MFSEFHQTANTWSRDFAVVGSTWLKLLLKEEVRRFYLLKDTFDSIPIPVFFILEPEAMSLTGVFLRGCAINEKHGVIDVVLLAEFGEKRASNYVRTCRHSDSSHA